MKFIYSISFSLIILLTGFNISVAEHYCKGKIAATKISVTGKTASCGMESNIPACPSDIQITSNCCNDKVSVYSMDDEYASSPWQVKEVLQKIITAQLVPFILSFHSLNILTDSVPNVIPPGKGITSLVDLADICIFRLWLIISFYHDTCQTVWKVYDMAWFIHFTML